MNNLPEMTVEQRESTTAHRVPLPTENKADINKMLSEAIILNGDAKLYEVRHLMYAEVDKKLEALSWKDTTLNILHKYISKYVPNLQKQEIKDATLEVFGFVGFDQVAYWVQNDMCSEVFNKMLKYALKEGQVHKKDKGFIDGSGIGYLALFERTLKKNIEKTFDAKWFYKKERPLVLLGDLGLDLIPFANKVHPGHWRYSQGHSTKSFTALEVIDKVFHLDKECYRKMLIAAFLFGYGRDANLIHIEEDTPASGYNTTLKEFE